jgi:hypothetical protein
MSVQVPSLEDADRRVRDWLFLLLRFAITRDPGDRAAVMDTATALDRATRRTPSSFSFFVRTSGRLCDAILQNHDIPAQQLLRGHAAGIHEPRLRAAFLASVGLNDPAVQTPPRRRALWRDRDDLWRGLPKRPGHRLT